MPEGLQKIWLPYYGTITKIKAYQWNSANKNDAADDKIYEV